MVNVRSSVTNGHMQTQKSAFSCIQNRVSWPFRCDSPSGQTLLPGPREGGDGEGQQSSRLLLLIPRALLPTAPMPDCPGPACPAPHVQDPPPPALQLGPQSQSEPQQLLRQDPVAECFKATVSSSCLFPLLRGRPPMS